MNITHVIRMGIAPAILGAMVAPASSDVILLSQERYIKSNANAQGPVPWPNDPQLIEAQDFGPFSAIVASDASPPDGAWANSQAVQDTTLTTWGFWGMGATAVEAHDGYGYDNGMKIGYDSYASARSFFKIEFLVTTEIEASLIGHIKVIDHVGPNYMETWASVLLSGPGVSLNYLVGDLFGDSEVYFDEQVTLAPGEYTLRLLADASNFAPGEHGHTWSSSEFAFQMIVPGPGGLAVLACLFFARRRRRE